MRLLSFVILLIIPFYSYAQLFKPKSNISGFEHAIEFGISKGINSYRFNSFNIGIVNSYHWHNLHTLGAELGIVTGMHYGDAISNAMNKNGNIYIKKWEGMLAPLYFQLKLHFPFRKTYRLFTPYIGINCGHMFDISGKSTHNPADIGFSVSNDMSGSLLGYFIGANLYSTRKIRFYFQIERWTKNNHSLFLKKNAMNFEKTDDNLEIKGGILFTTMPFITLKWGVKF